MSPPLVGLDIGYATVRAIAVKITSGGPRVIAAEEVSRFDDLGERKPLGRVLAEIDSRISLRGRVSVGAHELTTMVRFEYHDPIPHDRLERLLRLELSQHVGGDQNDLAADAVLIPLGGDDLIHCCALAQASQVHVVLQELRRAGIPCDRLDLPAAALANIPWPVPDRNEDDTSNHYRLVVDIGARATRVALLRDQDFLACRQITYGGDQFTEHLAKVRSLRFNEAERIKRSPLSEAPSAANSADEDLLDFDDDQDSPAFPAPQKDDQPSVTATDDDDDAVLELVDDDVPQDSEQDQKPPPSWQRSDTADNPPAPPAAQPGKDTLHLAAVGLGRDLTQPGEALYIQVNKTLAWFRSQLRTPSMTIDAVGLVGGGAQLPGLPEYLARRLKVPVTILDPAAGLCGVVPEPASSYAMALGLALGEAPGAVAFDLRPESILRRQAMRRELVWPRVAAVLLLLAAALAGAALWTRQRHHDRDLKAYQDYRQRHEAALARLDGLQHDYRGLVADFREIASRLYGGRDLLYTIRALKENAPRELWLRRLETQISPQTSADAQPGRSSGRRRPGTRPSPQRPQNDTHSTNPIDRGSVLLSGFVRPETDKAVPDLVGEMRRWRQALLAWRKPHDGQALFENEGLEYLDARLQADSGTIVANEEFSFAVRFHFAPTRLLEDDEPDAQGERR